MSPEMFPATRAAIRRLEEMYASGQIARPAAKPDRDDAPVASSGWSDAEPRQASATEAPYAVTFGVTVNGLPASSPVSVSISISAASDGPNADRPSTAGERPSGRRAVLDLRNRMRRLGVAENAR